MKKAKLLILSPIIALFIFIICWVLAQSYDILLIRTLRCTEAFFYNRLFNSGLEIFKSNYQTTYLLVFVLTTLSKYKLLFIPTSITWLAMKLFKWFPNGKFLFFSTYSTFIFIFVLELSLNLVPYKKYVGLSWKDREIDESLTLMQMTGSDNHGINYWLKDTEEYLREYEINEQGFISSFNFDSSSLAQIRDTSKLLMFVGDSHTEGCCANPVTNTFVNLIDKEKNWTSLNFGVGGTDPLQYELIVGVYLSQIKPDILIIPFCLGNDFMDFQRVPMPGKPINFQTNFNWVNGTLPRTHPNFKPDTYFKNWGEAKKFYLENYNVTGSYTSFLEKKFVQTSNLISILYFSPKNFLKLFYLTKNALTQYNVHNNVSRNHILTIQEQCSKHNIPFLLVGVPTIRDVGKNIKKRNMFYKSQLNGIAIEIPQGFELKDFVSTQNDHFVNSGHLKFSKFLIPLIKEKLEKE